MSHGGIPVCSECGAAYDLASLTTDGCAQTGLCYACLSANRNRQQAQIARDLAKAVKLHKASKQEALFDD